MFITPFDNVNSKIAVISEETAPVLMEDWLDEGAPTGSFWVFDSDGWAHWANPRDADNATALLVNSVMTSNHFEDEPLYAILPIADFVTAENIAEFFET